MLLVVLPGLAPRTGGLVRKSGVAVGITVAVGAVVMVGAVVAKGNGALVARGTSVAGKGVTVAMSGLVTPAGVKVATVGAVSSPPHAVMNSVSSSGKKQRFKFISVGGGMVTIQPSSPQMIA